MTHSSDIDPALGRLGPLAKLRPETLDNFRNVLGHLREPEAYARASDFWPPLPEGYVRGEHLIHVHLAGLNVGLGSVTHICAIFKHAAQPDMEVGHRLVSPCSTNDIAFRRSTGDLEQPVFVSVVEFLQEIEGITIALVPSLVWLQPLNYCLMFAVQRGDQFSAPAIEVQFSAVALLASATMRRFAREEDRKLRPCQCFLTRSIEAAELVDQAVKGRPKMVGDLADADAQVIRWEDIDEDAQRVLLGLRIKLGWDNSI